MVFTLQSCGAKYRIEGDPFEETDVDNVVLALVNLARKVFSIFLTVIVYLDLPKLLSKTL